MCDAHVSFGECATHWNPIRGKIALRRATGALHMCSRRHQINPRIFSSESRVMGKKRASNTGGGEGMGAPANHATRRPIDACERTANSTRHLMDTSYLSLENKAGLDELSLEHLSQTI